MEKDIITASIDGGKPSEIERMTPVRDLLSSTESENRLPYVGAVINNEVQDLSTPLESSAKIRFIDMKDPHGWLIYRNTALFILNMAVDQLFGEEHFTVEHSLGTGCFCRFEDPMELCGDEYVGRIERRMHEIVGQNLPIERVKLPFERAINEFKQYAEDKYKLLRFQNPPYVEMYRCDAFMDLAHAVLCDRSGAVETFRLIPHQDGLIIQIPSIPDAPNLTPFVHQPNLFSIFQEYKRWGRILGVRTAGDLNEVIYADGIPEFIRTAEALHEKKLAYLADRIADNASRVKWIFLAGPSSSGKTTFAKRLSVELKLNGLQPFLLSMDNYFLERKETPIDENGAHDFESIDALDLDFLHRHFKDLESGKAVRLPRFNFSAGIREYTESEYRISEQQVVIVEGIHGLNPLTWEPLPAEHIFKIYVSALTQLNLDYHNRLSTTDNRLMRRLVRDHKFRGNDALETLRMWPNVRGGEDRWIFPFQEQADAAFNSALDYEIPVLKLFVEPLLLEVKPYHEVYPIAQRLIRFLSNFLAITPGMVPRTSILREFIGRSSFRY